MRLAKVDTTVFDIMSEQRSQVPEVRLLWAVMKRWLMDYTGICNRSVPEGVLEIRFDAVDWAWDESTEPFSFLWICERLDLEPEWLRRNVDKIATEGLEPGSILNGRLGSLDL